MRNPTDKMRQILTNETAQRIIDFVSPIYGESYVGLWLYQAIGSILDEVCGIADQLRYETHPSTATLLLDQWEDHYKIPRDASLTTEQRRQRILNKLQSKGACTPSRLAAAVSSALGGIPVEIEENIAKNTFGVNLLDSSPDITPALTTLDRKKPAHLIYRLQTLLDMEVDTRIATAVTHAETFGCEIECLFTDEVEAVLRTAVAMTHSEHYFMEVL